jgi:hypothetical protein
MMVRAATALVLLLAVMPAAEAQQHDFSGNYYLSHCRSFIEMTGGTPAEADRSAALATKQDFLDEGFCAGTIRTMRDVATFLKPPMRSCPPVKIPLSQVIRVVITFMEQHPQTLDNDFSVQAMAAIKNAWPCETGPEK